MFDFAGVSHPAELTESAVLAWCGQAKANNTMRNPLSRVCAFLRWCVRHGQTDAAPDASPLVRPPWRGHQVTQVVLDGLVDAAAMGAHAPLPRQPHPTS